MNTADGGGGVPVELRLLRLCFLSTSQQHDLLKSSFSQRTGNNHNKTQCKLKVPEHLCARWVLHCAGSGEVPYVKCFTWHT
jgi:hypothetical protein